MKPKISIIVPVYNAENYLEKCIDSVLNQTFRDFELILVNDGSLDSSGAICDEYSQKDKRIIVIHKKNGGQSSARNAGLDIVKGEYIGFVDSDDWIEPEMYEILYNNIFETNSDISICKTRLVKQNNKEKKIECLNKRWIFEGEEIYDKVFSRNIFEWGPCNKLYKFSKIFNIRFLEGRVYEDVIYNLLVYRNINRISYIDNFLYNYRVDNLSTTRQEVSVKRLDLVKNILDNYEVLPSKYQTQFLESIYPIVYKIIVDIVDERKILKKRKILYEMRFILKTNKKNLNKINNINFKQKILYKIIRFSPFLFAIYKKLNSFGFGR